jgi:2-polyprenyl-3-methyl-5-hydroxy-6-metoxy-1,4-benzoquinol methylase
MEEDVSIRGERREVELSLLAEAVSTALGVCRVGLVGETAALVKHLIARGMACPENGPFDAWVLLTDIVHLERGEGLPPSIEAHPLFVACQEDVAKGEVPLRARIEAALIHQGYIKHPATTELFGYSLLDVSQHDCWGLFDFRPAVFADGDTAERLKRERDLHSDMLREPGVRSDAHVVRYQLAASLVRPGDTVLDAACGLGYGSHVLAGLSPAARVTGIDLSDWAVDYAKRNYGSDRVDFICGSLPDVLDDVPDGSVDFVVSLETLEHVADPVALLATFERVLKPGGRIFVSVPNDWSDETGKDPNPHHLHVYDWVRIRRELDAYFIVESAWSLTASGCKTGTDRAWRPQPRKLEQVALDDARATEGEWWLVCATKSPLAKPARAYDNTVHADFLGRTHLVDFAPHYDYPWLVHALVELPWRIRDKAALAALAHDVIADAHPGSADLGAALAVAGWRVLEDSGAGGDAANDWLRKVDTYLVVGSDSPNPHVRRWCVSLNYLLARFLEARGEIFKAIDAYRRVADADVLLITPTLGTKLADAALRAGALAFREGMDEAAVACWQAGLNAVFRCLQADQTEFIGNADKPFIFAMNDLVEIADGAARLANAIRAVTGYGAEERATAARQLGAVTHRSLRSALAQLQVQFSRLTAENNQQGNALSIAQTLAHRHLFELEKVQAQLTATEVAKANAEELAMARYHELGVLAKQLEHTDQAKAVAEELAHRHLFELEKVQAQLTATEVAKANAEELAMARYEEINLIRDEVESFKRDLRNVEGELDKRHEQLTDIQHSVGYKLLAALRLVPNRGRADV